MNSIMRSRSHISSFTVMCLLSAMSISTSLAGTLANFSAATSLSNQASVPNQASLPNQIFLPETTTATIIGGNFRPLFAKKDEPAINVATFLLDKMPVTNVQYLRFIRAHPQFSRTSILSLYADENYLAHWQRNSDGEFLPSPESFSAPVVQVSWFAAQAYCRAQGKRLPSTAQWEWVAQASVANADARRDPVYTQQLLEWYAKPTPEHLANVRSGAANFYGVYDLQGLIWEWTSDFNSVLSSGESRGDSTTDNQFFCGGGAAGSANHNDYATFMRYALRSSLSARYTLANLGFRCAGDE
jgi:formylglycine-generating enzyme